MKRLVLVGGGHAHLSVLSALAHEKPRDVEVTLVTPSIRQNYSGMLPGWMAGHYTQEQCQIDLRPLAQAAQASMRLAPIVSMDAARRCVGMPDGQHLEYDLLSLDIGSEIDTSWLEVTGEKLLPVKPLENFFEAWLEVLATTREQPGCRLVVVGGGAAGVELALAARYAFTRNQVNGRVDLVVSESGLLRGHTHGVQRRIEHYLSKAGVFVHSKRAVGVKDGVMLSNGILLPADCVIAATGARAPCWLKLSKLMLDENGYITVDHYHRSLSHPNVFAAGDICSRQDLLLARSGVHAVHAGPVLASNLLASLTGESLRPYQPRRRSLYLLACGSQYAVASWGSISAEGVWVWRWKDWIDRRFIERFSNKNRPLASSLTKGVL